LSGRGDTATSSVLTVPARPPVKQGSNSRPQIYLEAKRAFDIGELQGHALNQGMK